jgi:hypothetical protein
LIGKDDPTGRINKDERIGDRVQQFPSVILVGHRLLQTIGLGPQRELVPMRRSTRGHTIIRRPGQKKDKNLPFGP